MISHPRSGLTWLRWMLFEYRKLAFPHEIRGKDDELVNPWCRFHHDDVGLMSRLHRVKERLRWDTERHKWTSNRVLFLARDPRDVIISNYHRLIIRDKRDDLTLEEFFRSPRWGFGTLCKWLKWWDSGHDSCRDFRVIYFEDTLQNPAVSLSQAVRFFTRRKARPDVVPVAVSRSTFEIMRKREEETKTIFRDQGGQIGDDRRTAMVRKGSMGQWRELSPAILDYCDEQMKRLEGTIFSDIGKRS